MLVLHRLQRSCDHKMLDYHGDSGDMLWPRKCPFNIALQLITALCHFSLVRNGVIGRGIPAGTRTRGKTR